MNLIGEGINNYSKKTERISIFLQPSNFYNFLDI